MPWFEHEQMIGDPGAPFGYRVRTETVWVCSKCDMPCEEGVDVCGDCIAVNIPEAYLSYQEIVDRMTPWDLVQSIMPTSGERATLDQLGGGRR